MQATRMIMKSSNICKSFFPNSVYTQCIRWKRKPMWLPKAKTKIFRISKRPVIPIEETIELKRLFNVYRTYMSSHRLHIQTNAAKDIVELNEENLEQIEQEDFEKCKTINNEWNANVAKIRDVRLRAENQAAEEKAVQLMVEIEQKQQELKEQVDKEIRKLKEEAVTFITAKNIDAAIEECLANVINHNRALDLNGDWHDSDWKYSATQASD